MHKEICDRSASQWVYWSVTLNRIQLEWEGSWVSKAQLMSDNVFFVTGTVSGIKLRRIGRIAKPKRNVQYFLVDKS